MVDDHLPTLRALHDRLDRACLGVDTEIFFIGGSDPTLAEPARRYCRRCPILVRCMGYALTHHVAGVWGGTTDQERDALRAQHRITVVQPMAPFAPEASIPATVSAIPTTPATLSVGA